VHARGRVERLRPDEDIVRADALELLAELGGPSVTIDEEYGRDGSWGKALVDQREVESE